MKTIVAISEGGRLVGTYEPAADAPARADQKASATILPGKRQKLHELQIDDGLLSRDREKDLVRLLKRRLRLK